MSVLEPIGKDVGGPLIYGELNSSNADDETQYLRTTKTVER